LHSCRAATIIQMPRPEILIQIVAAFSSRLSRYSRQAADIADHLEVAGMEMLSDIIALGCVGEGVDVAAGNPGVLEPLLDAPGVGRRRSTG
jgi:hypothetical protein